MGTHRDYVNEGDATFPRINLHFVIQHVEPYKYINMYFFFLLDYFDKYLPLVHLRSFYHHDYYIRYLGLFDVRG